MWIARKPVDSAMEGPLIVMEEKKKDAFRLPGLRISPIKCERMLASTDDVTKLKSAIQ